MNKIYDSFRSQDQNREVRTEQEAHRLQIRTGILIGLFVCILAGFFCVLYQTQIVNGEQYRSNANVNITRSETVDSVRGEILDRYGRVLVTNSIGYQITLDTSLMGTSRNEILSQLLTLCQQSGLEWKADALPVSAEAPYTYTKTEELFWYTWTDEESGETEVYRTRLGRLAEKLDWAEDVTKSTPSAQELLQAMADSFQVELPESGAIDAHTRQLLGVLYEVALRTYEITYSEYIFAEDVDISFITKVKEHSLTGVVIDTVTSRQYNTTHAAHVLGNVGGIPQESLQEYLDKGYPMNAIVGRAGVESAFEDYLHGKSGVRQIETNESGKIVNVSWKTDKKTGETLEPSPGGNVVLTLDIGLQGVTEDLLAQFVQKLENPGKAAAVVVDMTGGVLAMASYPTYDPASYRESYNDLLNDPNRPLVNNATTGLFAPGSTFKMVTAIAALDSGVITPYSTVPCTGVYTYYPDVRPRCWIYSSTGGNHGVENVTDAIKDSCNIFFYDVGRRTGISTLVKYANLFGLGEYTGIELPESKGYVAGPDTSALFGQPWYDGQTMYASIGQENNQFTPLQLANYVATLVNGGNNYQVHLLKEVKSSDYSQVLHTFEPVLRHQIDIDPQDLSAVKQGMYNLSKTASMAQYFSRLPVEVGCKTGTAEVLNSSANAVFVCFAPYDNPQVALCLVAENGASGGNMASVAAGILEQYFSSGSSLSQATGENALLH